MEIVDGHRMKEGIWLSAGNGAVSVFTRPPHPNAVKLYLNWLMSRDGQYEFSKVAGRASRRTDVPKDHLIQSQIPQPGVEYAPSYNQEFARKSEEVAQYVAQFIKT
jgi:ABC-type Fe3+ transport system substrate-binding protein